MERKHIIYNLESLHNFVDYGIEIPLLNHRVLKTVNFLEQNFQYSETLIQPASDEDLLLAHTPGFIERIKVEPERVVQETYELINADGSFNRFDPEQAKLPLLDFINKGRLHVAGTCLAAELALESGFAYHLGGGMHHAMSGQSGGFCLFNDIVIAARKLIRNDLINKIVVIDLDCHKGDGTAEITKNDEDIFTFSIHMANGWPLDGSKYIENGDLNPSFIPSNCDTPIGHDSNYQKSLEISLDTFLSKDFDLAIIVHGVDVFAEDELESSSGIKLTTDEVLERDLYIYNRLSALAIPQAWCLGGGYGAKIHELYIQFLKEILEN